VPDIIQLLPDNIANQIAAGEVIQRPASAVKELLENAVDAGATEIKLIINDAGKALIQVIDNGKGMSITDARMAFERHATSKIQSIEDLFRIRTMGFRGEALASIAAVAQVELKTKRPEDELGTLIEIENSVVIKQEPVATANGTCICMKNLFFSVPARRNFLKSNPSELRHIIDEFIRVAMAFPDIHFSLTSNGQQVFYLERGSLKQRIVQILGSNYSARLVPVQENTDYLTIRGFVGKPETAKKTRGDQYFFVNNRFIRSAYLNHAVMTAFAEMIGKDSFPAYALFIDLDPAQLDINVHPTKQEIKFEDEKIVYAFVQAAIKHALAQFSVSPSLDFTLDTNIQQLDAVSKPFTTEKQQQAEASQLYNTFTQKHQAHAIAPSNLQSWREMQQQDREIKTAVSQQSAVSRDAMLASPAPDNNNSEENLSESVPWQSELSKLRSQTEEVNTNGGMLEYEQPKEHKLASLLTDAPLLQIHHTYIIAQGRQGFFLISQQAAHERILYEYLQQAVNGRPVSTQRSLFPTRLQLSLADAFLLEDLLPDLQQFGYHIEPAEDNSFIIQGTPADVNDGNETKTIEHVLEQFKHFSSDIKFSKREKLVRTMAWYQSIKPGRPLSDTEMQSLLEQLLNCTTPNVSPGGNPVYVEYGMEQLGRMFGR
jgi:DNA mismatch repair protein MutL